MTPCEHKTPFVGCEWCYRIVPDPRDEEIRELREKNEKLRIGLEGEEISDACRAETMAEFEALKLEVQGMVEGGGDHAYCAKIAEALQASAAAAKFQRERAEKSEAELEKMQHGMALVANTALGSANREIIEPLLIADNHYLRGLNSELRKLLPHLVDVVWGDAMEDGQVPSSEHARKLIGKAEAGWGVQQAQRGVGAEAGVERLLIEGGVISLEWNAKVEDLEAERDALQKEVSRWRQDAGLKAPVGWGLDALLDGQTMLREFAEAEVGRLREEITSCSYHHAQSWQLPDWAKTKADIDAATDAQLSDTLPTCHMEDGDPDDKCLACYAYGVICGRDGVEAQ